MDHFAKMFLVVFSASIIASAASLSSPLLLTTLIHDNRTQEARNASLVNPSLFFNVTSYSGFLTVDQRYNSNTFFWYFPVADKPVNETPWIIWLQGGPGASSLVGLFDELGPFQYNSGQLKLREWAWTKNHSMLFIDNPIGAGFSFTDSPQGFAKSMVMYTNHLYTAIQQFVTMFPELRSAPLYIAGESYAGHYVPALGEKILDSGKVSGNAAINLKGLIMGNPVLNREDIANYSAVFYQWGLIDDRGVLAAKHLQDDYIKAVQEKNVLKSWDLYTALFVKLTDITDQQEKYNFLANGYDLNGFMGLWKRDDVREALHVGDINFTFINMTSQVKLKADFLVPVQSKIEKLLEHYKILIYCGQLDLITPCVPNAEARRKKWHWSRRMDFLKAPRQRWSYNKTITGYVKTGGGFTEVLIKGAGHLVPIDKPDAAYQLISRFIRGLEIADQPGIPNTSDLEIADEPGITSDILEYKDKPSDTEKISPGAGLITSIALNVILVVAIVGGVWYFVRWKRRHDSFFYREADTISDDILLS